MFVEDGVCHELVVAQQGPGEAFGRALVERSNTLAFNTEGRPHGIDVGVFGGFGGRDSYPVGVDKTKMDSGGAGIGNDGAGTSWDVRDDRVEEVAVADVDSPGTEAGGEDDGVTVRPLRDSAQAVGAVVYAIHGCDDGKQDLRCADIGRRLLASDVLFAGLQREPVGRAAFGVDGDADQSARELTFESGSHRHERRMRAAIEHGDAETLARADDDVGSE